MNAAHKQLIPGISNRWVGRWGALAGAVLSCSLVFPGCSGPGSLFGLLGELGVSEEELQDYNDAVKAFNERVESLPSLSVRIVNETAVAARVSFEAGAEGPEPPEPDFLGDAGLFGYEDYLTSVDSQVVLVAGGGTATGRVKCGEVIALSASAPFDRPAIYGVDGEAFGLYVDAGNVSFTGLGAADEAFSGDTITGTRYLRPDMDGIDCTAGTLVIRIQSIATVNVYDDQTGELLTGGSPGAGVLELE